VVGLLSVPKVQFKLLEFSEFSRYDRRCVIHMYISGPIIEITMNHNCSLVTAVAYAALTCGEAID
jgi:hypothetical protein